MSILKYFERADVLPDPRGTLATSLPPRVIAQANAEVRKSLDDSKQRKERGSYHLYNPKMCAAIGKYASTNGVSATSCFFSGKLKHHISMSTVLSIKKWYTKKESELHVHANEKMVDIVKLGSFLGNHNVDHFYLEVWTARFSYISKS